MATWHACLAFKHVYKAVARNVFNSFSFYSVRLVKVHNTMHIYRRHCTTSFGLILQKTNNYIPTTRTSLCFSCWIYKSLYAQFKTWQVFLTQYYTILIEFFLFHDYFSNLIFYLEANIQTFLSNYSRIHFWTKDMDENIVFLER